ncbi:predicted protein [Sclerotinia sclerotiorum 1980 UF-70]|uniref:Uncharacterized protein n=1 Tax=Sclerotinia sclerotiorum (strain ATCC 18683 / 1980 / Ss-1) TaxID=665079 RepID=A7E9Y0_SCLS1|nr:predicted protein [Sclerotinia sclerotiorum 1980 UF-70]EDN97182.1 predicted protein [Sclerotinia sclerotiorum 1980 UF-70]
MPPKRTPVSKIQKTAASLSSQLLDLYKYLQYQLMRDKLEVYLYTEIIQEFEVVKEKEARNQLLLQQGASLNYMIPSIERESTNPESFVLLLDKNISFYPYFVNRFYKTQ